MYATSVVSVRETANTESTKLGSLSFADEVHVIGRNKDNGWYKIDSGWVSGDYLSDAKPEPPTTAQVTPPTQASEPTEPLFSVCTYHDDPVSNNCTWEGNCGISDCGACW